MQLQRRSHQHGFSLIELIVVIAIIFVLLAIAIPNAMNVRRNTLEAIVMREIQTIHQAQVQYMSQFGKYAGGLEELGPPKSGSEGPRAANLIPASLASGEKDGYLFTLKETPEGYVINANPKVFGSTGRRTFYLDQNGVIHHNWGPEPATTNSPEIGK